MPGFNNTYCEFPDVKAEFRKGRRTRDQTANIHWIIEKSREFQKNIYFCFIDYDGHSISSKGFLPTVVDIMVI